MYGVRLFLGPEAFENSICYHALRFSAPDQLLLPSSDFYSSISKLTPFKVCKSAEGWGAVRVVITRTIVILRVSGSLGPGVVIPVGGYSYSEGAGYSAAGGY